MIPYRYTYLVVTIIFILIWIPLFIRRKDLRREMLVAGLLVVAFGVPENYFFFRADWWHPEYIMGKDFGLEDILLGLTNGGVAAVLFEEIFKRGLYKASRKTHPMLGLSVYAMGG